MKSIIAAILIFLTCMLAACGGGDETDLISEADDTPQIMASAAAAVTDPAATERMANYSFDDYTVTLGSNHKVPNDWACTNYPRQSAVCLYSPGAVSILSAPYKPTLPARYAYPASPKWWQQVNISESGTYYVTATMLKTAPANYSSERGLQAVTLADGLTQIMHVPHADLVPGVEKTVTVEVPMSAGLHLIQFGTATRNSYGTFGYLYSLTSLSIQQKL